MNQVSIRPRTVHRRATSHATFADPVHASKAHKLRVDSVRVVRLGQHRGRNRAHLLAGVVSGRGYLHSVLGEQTADRVDAERVLVTVDLVGDHGSRQSAVDSGERCNQTAMLCTQTKHTAVQTTKPGRGLSSAKKRGGDNFDCPDADDDDTIAIANIRLRNAARAARSAGRSDAERIRRSWSVKGRCWPWRCERRISPQRPVCTSPQSRRLSGPRDCSTEIQKPRPARPSAVSMLPSGRGRSRTTLVSAQLTPCTAKLDTRQETLREPKQLMP